MVPLSSPLDIGVIDTVDINDASMNIWVCPYRKRSGKLMLYINSDRRCRLGISEPKNTRPLSNQSEEILLKAFMNVLMEEPCVPFTGSYSIHNEDKNHLAYGLDIYATNHNIIGGIPVARNGVYLSFENKLFYISQS